MAFAVVKGAAYALVHTPTVLIDHGTTQTLEREKNPESEYLKKVPAHLRDYEQAVDYAPNQTYIGNITPEQLAEIPRPWYENSPQGKSRTGRYGEIFPEDEFYGIMKFADAFDLVKLSPDFTAEVKDKLLKGGLFTEQELTRLGSGTDIAEIAKAIGEDQAEALKLGDQLVGCVKRAHDRDAALTAHIMFENIASKASAIIALRLLFAKTNIKPEEVEYIIEASEEACGDMNQRGGGNFAKSIGELCGCVNATGSDTRGFCAAPAHALVNAAALVVAGVYKTVVIVAGGATAKLGMNGRDHVNKGLPLLEDCLGAFAIAVGQNDGVNPIIRTDLVGRHTIGSGASPQAVMQALVTAPLEAAGLKITDIDKYSAEMQNPEITEPAGAGDVPKANFKMVAALAVKKGEIERHQIDEFIVKHGMPGFAPTQGHIPSGVPYVGFARDKILAGEINRAMIIGKGSLFLGRMTNLFDGISFVMEKNPGKMEEKGTVDKGEIRKLIAEGLKALADKWLE